MADLPIDLINNILDRVPKKSLLRFRCVSKLWRYLIDTRLEWPLYRTFTLYLFPMVSSRLYCIDLHHRSDMVEIENPLGWVRFVLLGSCYRVICISNCGDGQLAIWNVTTGKCELLPPADAEIPLGPPACVYGFGYDYRNNEFVLLRIVQTSRRPIVSIGSIFKSKAKTWRRLQGTLPYSLLEPGRMGVLLHGHLYWLMRRKGVRNLAKVLVAFDIRSESFVEVDLPNAIDNRLRMDLGVMQGRLWLWLTIYAEPGVVDVWIMNGLNRSWATLFSLHDHWWCSRPIRPLAWWAGLVLVQVSSTSLGCYNLQTRGVQPFHRNGMPTSFEAAICLLL